MAPASSEFDLRDPSQSGVDVRRRPTRSRDPSGRASAVSERARPRPADLYVENLLMGTYIIEESAPSRHSKTVLVGTVCSYPKEPRCRSRSCGRSYPEGDERPTGSPNLCSSCTRSRTAPSTDRTACASPPRTCYGPGGKFHPRGVACHSALIKKCVGAKESGDHIRCGAPGRPHASSCMSTTPLKGCACGGSAMPAPIRSASREPRGCRSKISSRVVVAAVGFDGEIRWDSSKARRAAAATCRRDPSRATVRLHAAHDLRTRAA